MLIAVVWHYWLAVGVVLLVLAATVGVAVGYLVKVTGSKYPPRETRQRTR